MKKFIFLLIPLLLVSGCNSNNNNNDNSNSGGEQVPIDEETLFNNFEAKLRSLEGHVNSKASSFTRTIDKMSGDTVAFRTISIDSATTTRYTYNDSYVVETNAMAAFLDDDGVTVTSSSNYKTQIYNDADSFYKVVKYDDSSWSSGDSCTSKTFTESSVPSIYNIGFALEVINDIEFMKSVKNNIKYEYSHTNFEGNITNNELKFGYELRIYTIYDGGVKSLSQKITYENTLTLDNGLIKSLLQKYSNIVYYAETPIDCAYVTNNVTYYQGEYTQFSGTLLPHYDN